MRCSGCRPPSRQSREPSLASSSQSWGGPRSRRWSLRPARPRPRGTHTHAQTRTFRGRSTRREPPRVAQPGDAGLDAVRMGRRARRACGARRTGRPRRSVSLLRSSPARIAPGERSSRRRDTSAMESPPDDPRTTDPTSSSASGAGTPPAHGAEASHFTLVDANGAVLLAPTRNDIETAAAR